MKIRNKTMAIVGITFIFLFGLLIATTEQIMGNSFEKLEKDDVSTNMERAKAAMDTKAAVLKMMAYDYAAWDDTYYFVQGQFYEYINETLSPDVVANLDTDMILFYDSTNKLYHATAVSHDTAERANISTAMLDYIAANEILFSHNAPDSGVSGIINSPKGPLLIASHPITQSTGEGPIAGTLIFARFIDDELINELAESTSLKLSAEAFNQERAASYLSSPLFPSIEGNPFYLNYLSESSVSGTTVLNDLNGNPALFLDIEMPRDLYQTGNSAIKFIIIAILGIELIYGLILSFSLDKSVLSRISLLSNNLTVITKNGSLSSRINMKGKDEVADLAGNINYMLQNLEEKEGVLKTLDVIESSLDSIDVGIMVVDINSRLVMNNKFIKMWGINTDLLSQDNEAKVISHIISQGIDDRRGNEWVEELLKPVDKCKVTLNLKNGVIYDLYKGPLLQKGKVVGTVYSTTDVTDRVKLQKVEEESKERLQIVLASIISGVAIVDAETSTIVDLNPIAEEMIGLPLEKIVGKSCHHFICPADKGKCPIRDLGVKVDRSERVLLDKDGNRIPILKSVVPITISGKKYLVESFVDLTKIKQAENSLIHARITAETANRAKSEFLATMSHELRTPLNSIIGFSDLIIAGSVGEISEKQKKFLGNVSMSGKHLLALINNILDISKIEAGKMELNCENFAVKETVIEVKQLVSPLIEKKGLKTEYFPDEKLVNIYGDKTRFKQILFNLASNAIKFTPAGGTITVSSKICGEMAQFTVRDTGIGISEKDQSKLFNPFTQLDSAANRMYEGTGLGLSLVKNFVELHKGKIWLVSEVGKGTAFTFEIPLVACLNKEDTKKESNDEAKKEKDGSKLENIESVKKNVEPVKESIEPVKGQAEIKNHAKIMSKDTGNAHVQTVHVQKIIEPENCSSNEPLILVVEDDDASRELLEVTLAQEGYRVASVASGKEALELANELKPFAITLDIMMPGMSGWDVLKHLKLKKETNEIPVIITTMLDEKDMGVVWGAVEHFIKPVQKDKLLSTLDKIKEKDAKSPVNILVVDDEKNAVELVAAMLNEKKFNVLKAYGGQEAINIAVKELPDVIILDLMMPDISGYDVIKALKSRPDTIDIPIIICTAKDLDAYDVKELGMKVSSIIHKGMFTREDLLKCIK